MSFLCTTINKEVSYHKCVDECQYIFKGACIDKMNEAYNQALEDILEKCDEAKYIMFKQYTVDMRDIREIKKELSK